MDIEGTTYKPENETQKPSFSKAGRPPPIVLTTATNLMQLQKRIRAWERVSHETKESESRLSSFETTLEPQFKLSQKKGCTQCFLFLILYLIIRLH
jgi:hypothetical protein